MLPALSDWPIVCSDFPSRGNHELSQSEPIKRVVLREEQTISDDKLGLGKVGVVLVCLRAHTFGLERGS